MPALSDLSSPNWQKRRRAVEALANELATQESLQEHQQLQEALLDILSASHQNLGALNAALQALTRLGMPVVTGLGRLLNDPNAETRALAVIALGEQHDEQTLPMLLKALDDPSINVRFNVVEALGKLGNRQAVEPLLALIEQGNTYLSFPAVQALAQLGDPTVVPVLVDLLEDEVLAMPAAEALGELGDPDILPHLAAWLESPTGEASSAATALGSLCRRCVRLLYQGPCAAELVQERSGRLVGPAGRRKVLAELERFAHRPRQQASYLPDLVRLAGWLLTGERKDGDANPPSAPGQVGWTEDEQNRLYAAVAAMLDRPEVRAQAAEALQDLGEAAVPDMIARLNSPEADICRLAAGALGAIRSRKAVPALLDLLDNPDPGIAASVAGALGQIGDQAAFYPLCDRLDHPAAIVRQAILAAIHSLGHPDNNAKMLELARAADPHVREAAIRSLAYFGAPGAVDVLLAALEDPVEAVRKTAVEGLPFMDDPRIPETLAALLHNGPPVLRAAAAHALGHLDANAAAPHLMKALDDPDAWTRLYACRSLAGLTGLMDQPILDEAVVERVLALLSDPMPPVRSAAAVALGRTAKGRAIEALQPLLHDPEEDVVLAAINTLAETRQEQAVPLLVERLENAPKFVQAAALAGLAKHGSRQAVQVVQTAVIEPATRRPALLALAQAPEELVAPVLVSVFSNPVMHQPHAREEAVDILLETMQAQHGETSQAAAILAGAAQAVLRSHPDSQDARRALAELLYRSGALYEPDLQAALLADMAAEVRQVAILALAATHSTSMIERLAALAEGDEDMQVRRAAQRAIQYLSLITTGGGEKLA